MIHTIRPDVLIVNEGNYSDKEITKLEEICGRVVILARQSSCSTSDIIRRIIISDKDERSQIIETKVKKTIEEMKKRVEFNKNMKEPLPMLFDQLKYSTDCICPVAAGCFLNNKWYFGTNKVDFSIPEYDIVNRTELYYATIEHAEINLLKQIENISVLNISIYTTLFPCDKCLKVLIDKGVKEIFLFRRSSRT